MNRPTGQVAPFRRRNMARQRLLEWGAAVVLALVLLWAFSGAAWLRAVNLAWWDSLQRWHAAPLPTNPLVIVRLDDLSERHLGRWPWAPDALADLLDLLHQQQVAAVALTMPLPPAGAGAASGPSSLAAARLLWGQRLVLALPTPTERGIETPPLQPNQGALAQWHPDADGVLRRLPLHVRDTDTGTLVPHMALAVLEAASLAPPPPRHWRAVDPLAPDFAGDAPEAPVGVRFSSASGGFAQHSALDVLARRLSPRELQGKVVLIGLTSRNGTHHHLTPTSPRDAPMPGVEVLAHASWSLLQGATLGEVSRATEWALGLALMLPMLLALGWWSPLRLLLLTLGLGGLALAISATLMWSGQWLWGPVPVMLAGGLTYGVWTLRRVGSTLRFLMGEFQRLTADDGWAKPPAKAPAWPWRGDHLDRRLDHVSEVLERARDAHYVVIDTLNSLPDPALVCNVRGRIRLANQAAERFLRRDGSTRLRGAPVAEVLRGLFPDSADHTHTMALLLPQPPAPAQREFKDVQGRDLVLHASPVFRPDGTHRAWMVSVSDISPIRQEQRERDDALHFLSHDLRSPQASTLALLAMARREPEQFPLETLIERIERHTRKAYALSDSFIQLLRAQSGSLRRDPCNLSDVLTEVLDDHWEQARAKAMRLVSLDGPDSAYCEGDREMLGRALGNLVGNAIKYAPAGSEVACGIEAEGAFWKVFVRDQGPGIPADERASLFKPFVRSRQSTHTTGAGLGLPMVMAVAQRMGGTVEVDSAPGRGSTFALKVPGAAAPPDDIDGADEDLEDPA